MLNWRGPRFRSPWESWYNAGSGQAIQFPRKPGGEHIEHTWRYKVKLIEYYLNKNKEGSQICENLQKIELNDGKIIETVGKYITLSSPFLQARDPSTEGN